MNVAICRAARELAAGRVEHVGDLDRQCALLRLQRADDRVAGEKRQRVLQPIAAAGLALELQAGCARFLEHLRDAGARDTIRRGQRLTGVQLAVGKTAQEREAQR